MVWLVEISRCMWLSSSLLKPAQAGVLWKLKINHAAWSLFIKKKYIYIYIYSILFPIILSTKSIFNSYVYFISIYALFSNSLSIFSDTLSNSTLYSLSIIFKYTFFILLSHLNIIFLFILYYYLSATITRITPIAITQIFPTHCHHHHHHKPNTTPSLATTNQQKLHHNRLTTASQDPTVTKSTTVRKLNPQPSQRRLNPPPWPNP